MQHQNQRMNKDFLQGLMRKHSLGITDAYHFAASSIVFCPVAAKAFCLEKTKMDSSK